MPIECGFNVMWLHCIALHIAIVSLIAL